MAPPFFSTAATGRGGVVVSHALMFLTALGLGILLQWGVHLLVRKPDLLAEPNERSSHSAPTPTMGGIAFVLVILSYFVYLSASNAELAWGLFASLALLAAVGLWDDLAALSARVRLVVHFVAAGIALTSLALPQAWWIWGLCGIALVWFINLYNFMDGIDGYAAVQCLFYCLGAQWVAGGVPGWPGELIWVTAGAVLAFLAFNWPPAKIFMGDVGSGFLGLLVAVLAVHLHTTTDVPLVASLILLAGFWFDATYTLCVRIVTKQEFTQAHRQHLYQHLALRRGHLWTTNAFAAYALFWLMPWAWLSVRVDLVLQVMALAAAVLPLAVACWRYKAGYTLPPVDKLQ